MVKLDQGADDPSETDTISRLLSCTIYSDSNYIVTNINDKGNSYILDSSDTEPYDLKKQPYSKQPCHTPDSDTPVTSVRPRIKLTRNPPTLDKSIWDKYDKEFKNIIEKE